MNLLNINWKTFNIMDVLKGCTEHYLQDILNRPENYKNAVRYRLQICNSCHMNVSGSCDNSGNQKIKNVLTGQEVIGCGCNINCKTALSSSECPAAIWLSIK